MRLLWNLAFGTALLLSIEPVGAAGFDAPLEKQEVLGKKSKTKVSCFYFAQFMIKQVDSGEKGAESLSMTPFQKDSFKPLCRKEASPSETVIPQGQQNREGYFKGVFSHYVFFDAADGVNGTMPFTAYDALTGQKVFEDFVEGDLDFVAVSSEVVRMRYRRAYSAPCSMVTAGLGCWSEIRKTLQLPSKPRPDCVNGYQNAKHTLAKARCDASSTPAPDCVQQEMQRLSDWNKSASVISYPAEVTDLANPVVRPREGPLRCWPVD